jgi:hypothetical protein
MNWSEKVLADPYLSKPARHLAAVIAKNFAALNARYAVFTTPNVLALSIPPVAQSVAPAMN